MDRTGAYERAHEGLLLLAGLGPAPAQGHAGYITFNRELNK